MAIAPVPRLATKAEIEFDVRRRPEGQTEFGTCSEEHGGAAYPEAFLFDDVGGLLFDYGKVGLLFDFGILFAGSLLPEK